eukprot:3694457-Pyramimonas_sp.AAC.1
MAYQSLQGYPSPPGRCSASQSPAGRRRAYHGLPAHLAGLTGAQQTVAVPRRASRGCAEPRRASQTVAVPRRAELRNSSSAFMAGALAGPPISICENLIRDLCISHFAYGRFSGFLLDSYISLRNSLNSY